MPFAKGTSGNPAGRPKRYWISEKARVTNARKAFKTLCDIRDDRIKEQEVDKVTGDVYTVAASVKEVREACKTIMAYSIGLPVQEVQHTGGDDEPFAFNLVLQAPKSDELNGKHNTGADGFEFHIGGSNGNGR
jgi:hypothetical protein